MLRLHANHKRHVCAFLLGIFVSFCSFADQSDEIWVNVTDTQNGQEVTASTKVSFTPLDFLALVTGAPADCSWIEHCESVKVYEGLGSHNQLVETVIDAPWPFKDRVMLVYSQLHYDEAHNTLTITLNDAPTQNYPISERFVRMSDVHGKWTLQQSNKDEPAEYTLSYVGRGCANGNIPKWLARSYLQSSTLQTFKNLKNHFKARANPL